MPHLVHIATVPESLGFVAGQVDYLVDRGWSVSVATAPGRHLDDFARRHDVNAYAVEMARAITPAADLDSVARLTDLLLDLDPDVVHGHTPKGGLLAMLAARAARVPARVYHMRGLLTLTASGRRRQLFKSVERTSCSLAHHVICQSESLRSVAVAQRLVRPDKVSVLGRGGNGVDALGRFDPENVSGLDVRKELRIADDDVVVGFVGRIVRDKGIVELLDAWRVVKARHPTARLLVVGPFEVRDAVPLDVERALRDDPRVHLVGFVRDTPRYYEAMDFLVLPSHREGFPNAPLEAAAMGLPCITTDAVGCVDAVADNITGLIVPVGDSAALAVAIETYVADQTLRALHGASARARVLSDFRPEDRHVATLRLYERLLEGGR